MRQTIFFSGLFLFFFFVLLIQRNFTANGCVDINDLSSWNRTFRKVKEKINAAIENKQNNEPSNSTINILENVLKSGLYEIRNLFSSGPSRNRIDVVFMGDGYTSKEKEKFFSDMNGLVDGTIMSNIFNEFLPLMNIWAIFTPSLDSGISYPRRQRRTIFKLYRPTSGILRSVLVGRPQNARTVCRMTGPNACDYPVIFGNDDYYGGLGGEFAISTSSKTSGALVLKHELGHNFARVGEEYDGGEVYSGVNSDTSLRNLKWRHWLTSYGNGSRFPREERLVYRFSRYSQTDLAKQQETVIFNSNGRYHGWELGLTLSGVSERDGILIFLDRAQLPWQSKGTKDKVGYSWTNKTKGLSRGRHNLTILANPSLNFLRDEVIFPILNPNEMKIERRIGSMYLYEFGDENEFRHDNSIISAYPTWDFRRRKRYRPTNNGCVMRSLAFERLCSVCNEGVWLQFLRRVSLIDDLRTDPLTNITTLAVIKLGQFRIFGVPNEGKKLQITWFKDRVVQPIMQDKLLGLTTKGQWAVTVKLVSSSIRKDSSLVNEKTRRFKID